MQSRRSSTGRGRAISETGRAGDRLRIRTGRFAVCHRLYSSNLESVPSSRLSPDEGSFPCRLNHHRRVATHQVFNPEVIRALHLRLEADPIQHSIELNRLERVKVQRAVLSPFDDSVVCHPRSLSRKPCTNYRHQKAETHRTRLHSRLQELA